MEVLNGKYVLDRPLGAGGMAEVFAGRSQGAAGFSRPIAIKRILPSYSEQPLFREMFETEARLSARLSHSNVVSVIDFDRDQTGRLYLVMEFVDGVDLDRLAQTRLTAGLLPIPVVLFVIREILTGLGHAHDLPVSDDGMLGMVHRDVSPSNTLLSWDGSVRVSDFGLAKARAATRVSASVFVKGKPAYMSPEQARGQELDGRSDLFAVGVMLWELLCGEPLFTRDSLEATLASVLFERVQPPRTVCAHVPHDVDAVAMKLLEKQRENRFRTADEAIAALAACADFPKNGRELLATVLAERLPDRAPRRRVPATPMPVASAPPTVPPSKVATVDGHRRPALVNPYEAAAVAHSRRARRMAWLSLAVTLIVAASVGVALQVTRRESARVTPAIAPPQEPSPFRAPAPSITDSDTARPTPPPPTATPSVPHAASAHSERPAATPDPRVPKRAAPDRRGSASASKIHEINLDGSQSR